MNSSRRAAAALVRKVWTHFVAHRAWPEKRRVLVELDEHGQDFEQLQREASGISVQTDDAGVERVQAEFDAVAQLAEGRDLFAPLPSLIGALIKRFSEHPSWSVEHDPKTNLPFAEIAALWNGDEEAALLAGVLMRSHGPAGVSPNFDATFTSYSITPSVEVLRYREAQSLDDVLHLHDYRNWTPTREEDRRRFINVVFGAMLEQGDWPNPIRAAIAIQGLGFVPQLVNELNASRPKIVYQHFSYFPSDRIELLLWSLTKLDDGDFWTSRVPKFVRAMYEAWKESPEAHKPLSAIAESAGLPLAEALALALLTEHEPWARYNLRLVGQGPNEWKMSADDSIRYFKECSAWDEYVQLRMDRWKEWTDGFGLPDQPTLAGIEILPDVPSEGEAHVAALLSTLHPRLVQVAGGLARNSHWDDAIGKALKGLHVYVADKAGLDTALRSDDLMAQAFAERTGPLRLAENKNEQQGYMFLFKGAFAAIRNPLAHRLVKFESAQGVEWLAFVSALYRLVDAAVSRKMEPPPILSSREGT